MSEAPRTYMRWGQSGGFSGGPGRQGNRTLRVVLTLAAVFAAFVIWVSRDTNPVHEFIALDRSIQLVVPKAMLNRERVAGTPLWSSVSEATRLARAHELLNEDFGFPEWMLRNLVGGNVIITGNDLDQMSDLLYITRMTTVGCVIQRAIWLRPGIKGEWAGGLKLRKFVEADVWYAARGRTLIASSSREALVRALTLRPDEQADAEAVDRMMADAGAEDARGTFRPAPEGTLGRVFGSVHFAMRIEDNGRARLQAQGVFRPKWRERLAETLGDIEPRELRRPAAAPIAASGDFGVPLKELWLMVGEFFGSETMSEEQWEDWEADGERAPAAAALTSLLGPAGPGFTMTWQGFDMNEMAPVPLIFGTVNADKGRVTDYLEGLSGAPRSSAMHATLAYYDAESELFHAPIMSGPSMEPTAAWHGDGLLFSTSRDVAQAILAEAPAPRVTLRQRANLYLRIEPLACTQIITDAGRRLARDGLLRGYTVEEYRKAAAEWIEQASNIDEATIWLVVNEETVEIDLQISPGRGAIRVKSR